MTMTKAAETLPDPKAGVTPKSTNGPYFVRLKEAAEQLSLSIAELLSLADEGEVESPLFVCIRVPEGLLVHGMPTDYDALCSTVQDAEKRLGHKLCPADRRLAYVTGANDPGFFFSIAAEGGWSLNPPGILEMVDGTGLVFFPDELITIDDLWIPRAEIDALKATAKLANEAEAPGPKLTEGGRASLLAIIGALARLLGKTDEAYGTESDPSARKIAKDCHELLPPGLIAEGSLENAINDGLRQLEPGNSIARKRGRKRTERPSD